MTDTLRPSVRDQASVGDASAPAADSTRPPRTRRAARAWTRIGAVVLVLAVTGSLWWLFAEVVFAADPVVAKMGPVDTVVEAVRLLGRGGFLDAITVSLARLLGGLALAVVIGVPVGIAFGARAGIERAVNPVVQFLRMTSPLAWAPLAIVLLGAGTGAVVALVAMAAVWPVVLGVSAGVRRLDPGLARVARSLGATRWEVFRTTALPALAEPITGSIRVALGIAWVVLVPAEMLGVANGLGYAILNARDNIDYTQLAAVMFVIGALGFLLDRVFEGIHRLVRHPWEEQT